MDVHSLHPRQNIIYLWNVKGFIFKELFFLSQLFMVLVFPLSHSHVLLVRALVGFVCTSGLGGFFFQWRRCPHLLGCLLVTTKILRCLCCFCCHDSESDGSQFEPVGIKKGKCFWEFAVLFWGFGCACEVCYYCLQYFITDLIMC